MITEFKLPELGENIESANVTKVMVSVGDNISKDQAVMELETDKATIELPSSVSGTVKEIRVKEGGTAQVGQVVLTVDSDVETEPKSQEVSVETAPSKEKPVTKEPETGKPVEEKVPEKKELKETKTEAAPATEKAVPAESVSPVAKPPAETRPPGRIAPAAPSVRRLAREIGIDIQEVQGSGPAGRISIEDVKNHAKRINMERRSAPSGTRAVPPLPDFTKWGPVERKPMTNIRLKTAEHLSLAWSIIAQVTQFDKADITELEERRRNFGSKAEAAGGKLTVTAILLKVLASALRVFPQFSSSLDMATKEIIYKKYFHIGVAVDTDRGLLVPVIRDVDKKNVIQLSVELSQMAEKARNKKLTLEDMQGGTFTITNLGGFGGTYFSPIVNYPEVAILGISRSNIEPVYVDGKFEPRTLLPMSVSYDHRVIDGADAVRFLRWIVEALQDPFLLALEG